MADEWTLYIIVNAELKMGKGKIASQVGHVTEMIVEKIFNPKNPIHESKRLITNYKNYAANGRKKIVLKASQQELERLSRESDAIYVIDAGRTQIPANSMTVVGFLPSNRNSDRFKQFKLM